jgi:isopenicillin N synthase-like dioxygenase
MTQQLPLLSLRDPQLGAQFVASLREFGFAALINHPLDMALVETIYQQWRDFFASGDAANYPMDPVRQDGYFSIAQAEHAKGYAQRDFKEYFQYYSWGRCPEALRQNLADYFTQAVNFASTLLGFVEAHAPTDIRARFSQPLHEMIKDSQQSMLRVLHYPPVPKDQTVLRAAPHEDINLLTLLPAADGPGLQIRGRDGEWLSVPNEPNQVLVNIGDMLQEASGGWFPSTTHQVAPPSAESLSRGRMSLPLFLHPRPDVVLSERYTARTYLEERLCELGVA